MSELFVSDEMGKLLCDAGWVRPMRCRYCENYSSNGDGTGICYHPHIAGPEEPLYNMRDDDYCSYGSREWD